MCEEVVSGNDDDGHGKRSEGHGSADAKTFQAESNCLLDVPGSSRMMSAVHSFRVP